MVEREETPASASSRTLDRAALEALPARSVDEVLRAMPGLHLSAHGGHGKAYQYFLRGFDAVHGADLAIDLQGVPINELSNVHANGYLDMHFIPPMLLAGADLWPGTGRADAGNYAVAGSASLSLGLSDPGGQIWLGAGTDRSGEATLAWRPKNAPAGTFLIADTTLGKGVGEARSWRQVRGGAGYEGRIGSVRARVWGLAYDGVFASPGVLRLDDLEAGRKKFYDAYPGSGGGHSQRFLAGAELVGSGEDLVWQVTGWSGLRTLQLRQNFSGWYDDPVVGDGTVQHYQAFSSGLRARVGWAPTQVVRVRAGIDTRLDRVSLRDRDVNLDGIEVRQNTAVDGTQTELGGWLAVPLTPFRGLKVEPAVRADVFLIQPDAAPLSWAPALAPKLSMVVGEHLPVTGFASYGRGYRSPDIRGVGDGGRAPLATADAFEVGSRVDPASWISLRAAGFATFISEEIVFDHVQARYLTSGSTRRYGVDGGVVVRPIRQLRVQADATFADGRYRDGTFIPYAPRLLVNAGVYAERVVLGPVTATAGLRAWFLGPRPLPGGFASRANAVLDFTSLIDIGDLRLSLEIDNVLGSHWRDGEFQYPSRWDPTGPRSELTQRHITAGTPRAARVALGRRF